MKDHIRYDVLTRDAMRGVIRRVLDDVARQGLPGDHHFYITFLTRADGVKISPRLMAQYPNEMTIILQHQFWDLSVGDDRFEVGLSFGNVPEKLVIPFAAVKGFLDPSVQFGLQFETGEAVPAAVSSGTTPAAAAPPSPPTTSDKAEAKAPEKPEKKRDKTTAKAKGSEPKAGEGAEVVRLDRFRKK